MARTLLLPPRHYLNDGYGFQSWLLTRDHKRIALLYLAAVTFFFFVGGAFAVVMRLELATPAGDLVSDETYNKLFTMHGVVMVFFLWSTYATSLINVLGTPVIAITVLLIAAERVFHFGFFDPARGGDPVLMQHLFWFYSHPAVYIMVLPAMGVVSELVAAGCRKPVFGYSFVAFASLAIAVLGFLVWGHHMFVAGESVYSALIFSILSFLVAIPSAIKVFNWTATLYKGSISLDTPMLYILGFIALFV